MDRTPEDIQVRMLSAYLGMMEIYADERLDKWGRRIAYACLLNNLRGLATRM
jgi:hypothetical protein